MPDPRSHLEPSQQLLLVLDRLGRATEHLARSVDLTIRFLSDVEHKGKDPVSFIKDISGVVGRVMDGISGKQKRRPR